MNDHTEYLIKRLHQVFDSEKKDRRNGGFGVPKPFKSIDDTLYGQEIEELQGLSDENEVLREALRLKEAECERLAHDKSVLLSFVERVSELDIEDWSYETDDGDGMCFEFIGETEIASDAVYLIEDIEGADNENQQAD